jgi:hypothetical protein
MPASEVQSLSARSQSNFFLEAHSNSLTSPSMKTRTRVKDDSRKRRGEMDAKIGF